MSKKNWFILVILFLATRIANVMSLPIFNDEAFFIHATRQIVSDPIGNIFFSFSDGKEPLFFWLYTIPVKFFPDALLGIRLFTALLGFTTLVYLLKIAKKLAINPFLTGLAFIFSPFLLFYHRIGMQEALLTLLLTASAYYFLAGRQVLLGIFAGLALLTKTSTLAFLIFLLPLIFYRRYYMTLVIALIISLPAVFGWTSISGHNSSYFGVIPIEQMLANLKLAFRWLWDYQGPMGVIGMLTPPVILEALTAKIFFPRYFLFITPFIILITVKIFQRRPWLFLPLLIPNFYLSFQIITNVAASSLPAVERWQYIESWPSGYGIAETADFLRSQSAKRVVTEDAMITRFGLPYFYPEAKYLVGGDGDYFVYTRDLPVNTRLILKYFYGNKILVFQKI